MTRESVDVGSGPETSERAPELHGQLASVREVASSDVPPLFTLLSEPAVTAYMAPPPPSLAAFAGFVRWAQAEREQGRGTCFAIVPNGMTTAVGILQIRAIGSTFATAEWGFVIGRHFWSTGIFYDAANLLANFAFSALHANRLEARIALRNARAHAAVQKLGARAEATIATPPRNGFQRDPQILWGLNEEDWRNRAPHRHRLSAAEATAQVRDAVRAATYALQANEPPSTVDPFPYFLFDRRRYEE